MYRVEGNTIYQRPLQMVQDRSVLFILVDFYSFEDCITRHSGDMLMVKLVPLR